MRKNEPRLRAEVNRALQDLRQEVFFGHLRERYLHQEFEKYRSYGLKFFF
jgi:hypothetical protein